MMTSGPLYITPSNLQYGIVDPLPLRGFPPGEAGIRMQHCSFVYVFVKTEDSVRWFAVKEVDGFWEPFCETTEPSL
jgi:hypothetical protein